MALSSYAHLLSWQLQPRLPPQPQLQLRPQQTPLHIGMARDDQFISLTAAAEPSFSYNYSSNDYSPFCHSYSFDDNMVVDPDPFLNYCSVDDIYEQQSNCFPHHPDNYFPDHPYDQLQLPFQETFDTSDQYSDYNCYYEQPQPLKVLKSFHTRNQPTAADAAAAAAADTLMRESLVNDYGLEHRKRVTAQSLAARERRRKITNKTRELGNLVPGANKMNTAEMLQSAFKYVKFLQSQAHLLQLMSSLPSSIQGMKRRHHRYIWSHLR